MMYMYDDTIFNQLLDVLKVDDRVVVTSHLFFEFKTNEERVALAYQLLEEENLLPSCTVSSTRKSLQVSTNLRNQGNIVFQKRKDSLALCLYNQSLAAAPPNTKEYALALGNRSAANFSLGFLEACLSDIDLALKNGYPSDLKPKLLERRVRCYTCLNKNFEAEQAMMEANFEIMKELSKPCNFESNLKLSKEELENTAPCLKNETPCNKTVVLPSFGCSETPPIMNEHNSEIPCASSSISLAFSEVLGRHLIALRDIAPGDVLIVEQPYASVLLPEVMWNHCYHCFQYCPSLVPCLQCSDVMFCKEECRKKSWEIYHSVECSMMPVLSQSVSKMGLLALRVLIIASQKGHELVKLHHQIKNPPVSSDTRVLGFNEFGKYLSSDYWPIHFLLGHTNHRAVADLFRRSITAACLLHSLKQCTNFFPPNVDEEMEFFAGGLLLQYLQSLPCNAHEVSEMNIKNGSFDNHEIGAAAYATLSLLNHSCDPNVVRHSYHDWAVLRAIRPIKAGEEILDNYGYHHALHELDERQTQLSKQYFFHCSCQACEGCWPLYKDQPMQNALYYCGSCGEGLVKNCESQPEAQCSKCHSLTNIPKLDGLLKESSKSFRNHLSSVLTGQQNEEILPSLLKHLEFLGKSIQRPWREFSECQEAIKQCLSLASNHVVTNV